MSGILYIVPTPVGNLSDMTFRAIEVLKSVDLILAEDTRTSGVLLRHYDINAKLAPHHKYNEHESVQGVVAKLKEGHDIALVSDAGTPGISDPGFMLSRECARQGIEVRTLPGPTAFVPALVSSGLPCERFCFEGFLPLKKGRATLLASLAQEERTMIFYESPLRLASTLKQFVDVFGADRPCCVSREISKMHESHHRGTLQELMDYFNENQAKGEIVIILGGFPRPERTPHVNKYRQ